jgi:hypothetical protein
MDSYHQKVEVIYRLRYEQREPERFRAGAEWTVVAAVGRRWSDGQGEHILVQNRAGQVFELIFDPVRLDWWLKRPQLPPAAV